MLTRLSTLILLLIAPLAQAAPRPNIIVILADDMGYSDIGCYGSEIETPNLDALARNGLRFTQFYNTARCCPTRASLLTGLYPHQAGMGWMTGYVSGHPGYSGELSHDTPTIASVLRNTGYATYMTGKWHLTNAAGPRDSNVNWPRQRGFQRFYGTVKGGGSYYDPAGLTRGNLPITPQSDVDYKPASYFYSDAIGDESARFVREHPQRKGPAPFFLYVAFTAPHWPLHAPEEFIAKYKGKYDAGYEPLRRARFERMKQLGVIDSSWQLSPAPWKWEEAEHKAWEARCMEVYAAQVDNMDHNIGKIIAALRETEQLDNTLILFLADNGGCAEKMGRPVNEARRTASATQPMKPDQVQLDIFPKHTRDGRPVRDGHIVMPGPDDTFIAYGEGWANVSNTPFREYKHWVHEGGISTPLVAHWPAGIARKGEIDHQPGHLIDLMPTFVELAEAKLPKVDGVTLTPTFQGRAIERPKPIFFEHESNRAVRDGNWKLVAKGIEGPWELYDIDADRSEINDLASAHPDRVQAMADAWQRWAEASHVLPLGSWQKKAAKPQTN